LNELYSAISKQENANPEVALLVAGDFNAGKLNQFCQISISMLNVQPEGKELWTTYIPHTETHTKLYLALHLANLTIIPSS
jgi:endonuclease/exonuclease/phosphatase family metal-dependent hydrolase